jgi:5-methylcytosine-specific restriction enzyme subunit McrC
MNTLFERFLTGYIKKHRSDILPEDRIESKIIAQSEGNMVYFASLEGKNKIRLQPDLLLKMGDSQHPYLLVDTKYKIINGNERKVSADDLYQVFAYSVRYHCHRVLLVYPQSVDGGLVRQKYAIQSTPATVFVGTVNLRIPLNNCPAFTEELRQLFNQAIHG